ncbi:MAG: hypothetical protein RIR65_1161 [Planctomycetota bacterium]
MLFSSTATGRVLRPRQCARRKLVAILAAVRVPRVARPSNLGGACRPSSKLAVPP